MGRVFFVSGIDTGIGKTIATGLLARSLLKAGVDATTVKMVQTGNGGRSEDLELHRELMGIGMTDEDRAGLTAPQIFHFPSSPQLAAALEHKTVDIERIASSVKDVASHHEVTLVESAGGLHVPLTDDVLSVDLAAREGWPLVLVTCGRLGSINHTFLSLEAAFNRKMEIAGVVYNWYKDADPLIDSDTPKAISAWLVRHGCADVVVRVPELKAGDRSTVLNVDFLMEGLK